MLGTGELSEKQMKARSQAASRRQTQAHAACEAQAKHRASVKGKQRRERIKLAPAVKPLICDDETDTIVKRPKATAKAETVTMPPTPAVTPATAPEPESEPPVASPMKSMAPKLLYRTVLMRNQVTASVMDMERVAKEKEEEKRKRREEVAKRKRERDAIMTKKDELHTLKKRKLDEKRMKIFEERLQQKENMLYLSSVELQKMAAHKKNYTTTRKQVQRLRDVFRIGLSCADRLHAPPPTIPGLDRSNHGPRCRHEDARDSERGRDRPRAAERGHPSPNDVLPRRTLQYHQSLPSTPDPLSA
jgi:hypothetical protein